MVFMLKHPVILAGFLVVSLLGLVAGALTFADRGGHSPSSGDALARQSAQPSAVASAEAVGAPGAQTLRTAAVRTTPGDGAPVLGTLPKDTRIDVDGRSSDSKWLRIAFPRGSDVRGWVDASSIDLAATLASLPVRGGDASVRAPAPPTKAAQSGQAGQSASASIRTSNTTSVAAASTATVAPAAGLPDLIVSGGSNDNGRMSATVKNIGAGAAQGTAVVTVLSNGGQTLATTSAPVSLKPGQSTQIPTGYAVAGAARMVLAVNRGGAIVESNMSNNELAVAVASN